MLNSLAAALKYQEKQADRRPCDHCGATEGFLLTSRGGACLCLPCFRDRWPSLYAGLYRWCQDHPPAKEIVQ